MNTPAILTTGCAFLFSAVAAAGAPDFSMIGYATVNADGISTTTGGGNGAPKRIRSFADLESWADGREKNTTPEVVEIEGKISASSSTTVTVKHGANITIIGKDGTAELENVGLVIWDYKNVIVRHLKIHEVLYPNDALTLDEVNHAWVDHCEFYSKTGAGIKQDTYDGLLDIKNGARWITVSWCRLHDHMKCSLVGYTDDLKLQAVDTQIRVTYHHVWFQNTDGRNPSVRFGAVHLFNNYYNTITDYGVAARDGAHVKIENCHFIGVNIPMTTDKFPVKNLPNGYILPIGNITGSGCGPSQISQTGSDFWNSSTLPYQYTLEDVNSVEATVKKYSGPGGADVPVNGAVAVHAAAPTGRTVLLFTATPSFGRKAASGDVFDIGGRRIPRSALNEAKKILGVSIVRGKGFSGK